MVAGYYIIAANEPYTCIGELYEQGIKDESYDIQTLIKYYE